MTKNKPVKIKKDNFYCPKCGHCGFIGCCGVRNFLKEHVLGKTNCQHERNILNEIIDCCNESWDRKEKHL
jgi:hypothetical protein